MKLGWIPIAVTSAALAVAPGALAGPAAPAAPAQKAKPKLTAEALRGTTWTLVRVDLVAADKTRVEQYGSNPKGLLVFDRDGRYTMSIYRTGRAKFASNDKATGTEAENKAYVDGTNSHFGTYRVDETDGVIVSQVEGASFPNWEGTERKSAATLEGDRLVYRVARPTTGGAGATGEVEWRRVSK